MATDFNKNAASTKGGFKPNSADTPLDVRCRVETEVDILKIPRPFIGMVVYVVDTGKRFEVLTLKDLKSGMTTIKNGAVDTYREIVVSYNDLVDKPEIDPQSYVSELDRAYWNSKFDMPMSGINESHLSMSLQNKLQNVFSIYDIVDSNTGNIREELLPNYNYDEIFLKKQTYNNYLENDWRLHIENKVNNNIHVNWEEKDRWNESYQRTIELPQRLLNIESTLLGAVQEKKLMDGTIDKGGTIKKELIPFASDMVEIAKHLNNVTAHLTSNEKKYLKNLGDPSLLQTKNETIVGAINELYDMLQELLAETHIVTKK